MKLLSAMLPLLCATAVTSSPLSLFGDSQQTLADTADLEVPGENPLTVSSPYTLPVNSQTNSPLS